MKRAVLIKFLIVMFGVFLTIFTITLYAFRSQALEESKRRGHIISEIVRDTLTSYMVMGTMDRRDEFLSRIREIEGVKEIRVMRGKSVVEQFGKGLKFEAPMDELERAVLATGKQKEVLHETLGAVEYKIIIPYKAVPMKGVDCLQCHKAEPGEVLGAISLTMDLSHVRKQSALVLSWLTVIFLIAVVFLSVFLGLFITKISNFIRELVEVMNSASEGHFRYDIKTDPGYEASLLKKTLEKSFSKLYETLKSIEDKVIAMMGYGVLKTGNVLSDTSKVVDELLNIYKFKRVIEKDKSKADVYERIREVIEDYMSLTMFSLYEVNQRRNRMTPIYVKGSRQWCNSVIFEDADECRAKRTGMDVDSKEFPCVCPNFIDGEACRRGSIHYYCIPLYVGGTVRNIVQLIYEPEMEPFVRLVIPYIKGYLNEAAPVLEARTYMDMLKEQSLRDQLTGLYNRRFLEETLDKIVAQTKRRGTTLGILMIDIDFFKQVNDTYGHDVGDRVLKEVSKVVVDSVRESDIVVRYGGEEFMVLLIDVQNGKSEEVAEKIRRAVENHNIEISGRSLKKTVSIGVVEFPSDCDKIWQCIKFADVALYRAKEAGRNRVVRFKPEFWKEDQY